MTWNEVQLKISKCRFLHSATATTQSHAQQTDFQSGRGGGQISKVKYVTFFENVAIWYTIFHHVQETISDHQFQI